MRKGRSGRSRSGFSVLERLALQKDAQQQREEQAKQAQVTPAPICRTLINRIIHKDIHALQLIVGLWTQDAGCSGFPSYIYARNDVSDLLQDSGPRKSPKKVKTDSAGRSSQLDSALEDRDSPRKSPLKAATQGPLWLQTKQHNITQ